MHGIFKTILLATTRISLRDFCLLHPQALRSEVPHAIILSRPFPKAL